MNANEIEEIRACLPRGKTPFYYFKDRYALELLALCVGDRGMPVRDIRATRCHRLLDKPVLRPALAAAGSGVLTRNHLLHAWPMRGHTYLLTLGTWGNSRHRAECQMSRPGRNLVLQLNFSNQVAGEYRRIFHGYDGQFWNFRTHPIASIDHETLAWARLDIDMEAGEALIEEIQSDWIDGILNFRDRLIKYATKHYPEEHRLRWQKWYERSRVKFTNWRDVVRFVDQDVRPHAAMWSEAMLWAAMWFLHKELGIRRIFYNSWETGNRMKGGYPMGCRSLYSTLPERFCFLATCQCPAFLETKWERRMRTSGTYHIWYGLQL